MKTGIVIANIGSPDAPTTAAVKKYLAEFLSDKRVVRLPRILWWPILHGYILRTRPAQTAQLYKKIWTERGSPQSSIMQDLAKRLEESLQSKLAQIVYVKVGMRYGQPSVKKALEELQALQVDRILIFPLFPQYSTTTTLSIRDAVLDTVKNWVNSPLIEMTHDYARDNEYIAAIAQSIRDYWQQTMKRFLLFSFHGIPQSYVNAGDTYGENCYATAILIANALELKPSEWGLAFQSRLGATKWLKPYTDKVLEEMPQQGIKHVNVVCPGFPVDCLETLEEIAIRGREQFLKAGGEGLTYIPALNAGDSQVAALSGIIYRNFSSAADTESTL
jgi:ferrochelatase